MEKSAPQEEHGGRILNHYENLLACLPNCSDRPQNFPAGCFYLFGNWPSLHAEQNGLNVAAMCPSVPLVYLNRPEYLDYPLPESTPKSLSMFLVPHSTHSKQERPILHTLQISNLPALFERKISRESPSKAPDRCSFCYVRLDDFSSIEPT